MADPEGSGGSAALPEDLYRATDALLDLFEKHGASFRKAVYSLSPGPRGRWRRALVIQ